MNVSESTVARTPRPSRCPGSGRRVTPTGSSSYPEVKCSHCEYEGTPVDKHFEFLMRVHKPVGTWRA